MNCKMKVSILIVAFFTIISVVNANKCFAETWNSPSGEVYTYSEENDERVTITNYVGTSEVADVTIPTTINGKKVVSIADNAFKNCTTIERLIITENMEYIGEHAFANCSNLSKLSITSRVTDGFGIGNSAFANCTNLTELVIPEKVTVIFHNAFAGCTNLKRIYIPNEVGIIGNKVFEGCTNLTIYCEPGSVAHTYAKDNNINYKCIIRVDNGAYLICEEDTDGTIKIVGIENLNSSIELKIPSTINNKKIDAIGDGAFKGCEYITSVTIPESIGYIGEEAFANCSNLTSLKINESSEEGTAIGYSAFINCSKLTEVTIPSHITAIFHNAFENCTGLKKIVIPSIVGAIGNDTFKSCADLTIYCEPGSVAETYAKDNNIKYKSIIIGSNGEHLICEEDKDGKITIIGIENVNSSIKLEIPSEVNKKTVKAIGEAAFKGCEQITSVTIPKTIEYIGKEAFGNCTNLTELKISEDITEGAAIGYSAFINCSKLTEVTIPNGITAIFHNAFENCTGLKKIVIPNEVGAIGNDVFKGCTNLTIYCEEGSVAEKYAKDNNIKYVASKIDDNGNVNDENTEEPEEEPEEDPEENPGEEPSQEYTYKVTSGGNQTYKNEDLTVKFDAPAEELVEVSINGKKLDKDYYTATEGSTVLTVSKTYLKTLKSGKYTLVAKYESGKTAETTFVVENAQEGGADEDIPQAGLFSVAACASLIALVGIVYVFYKKYKRIVIK